ncbi:hypothetical protein JS562_51200 [Agrobacterium sp. S2]|nr:hypothetical protein [Agrobacterium sp. S2]
MDSHELLRLVHEHANAIESHLVIATVRSYLEGAGSVRIEVTDTGTPGPYRYNATVYDGETGAFIATGNGAADVDQALAIVHWHAAWNRGSV